MAQQVVQYIEDLWKALKPLQKFDFSSLDPKKDDVWILGKLFAPENNDFNKKLVWCTYRDNFQDLFLDQHQQEAIQEPKEAQSPENSNIVPSTMADLSGKLNTLSKGVLPYFQFQNLWSKATDLEKSTDLKKESELKDLNDGKDAQAAETINIKKEENEKNENCNGNKRKMTSDRGWGCMIRSGQMALATILLSFIYDNDEQQQTFEEIIVDFFDEPAFFQETKKNKWVGRFGIHSIIARGKQIFQKEPGEWYGPSTISIIFDDLLFFHPVMQSYVLPDHTFYRYLFGKEEKDEEKKEAKCPFSIKTKSPVVFWMPVRLGVSSVHPLFFKAFERYMKLEQCRGILGGRNNKAFYGIGVVLAKETEKETEKMARLVYLDPHTVQPAALYKDFLINSETIKKSFEPETFYQMPLAEVDASLTFIFVCRDAKDMDNLYQSLETISMELLNDKETAFLKVAPSQPDFCTTNPENEPENF